MFVYSSSKAFRCSSEPNVLRLVLKFLKNQRIPEMDSFGFTGDSMFADGFGKFYVAK